MPYANARPAPRQKDTGYVRPPMEDQTFIPEPF